MIDRLSPLIFKAAEQLDPPEQKEESELLALLDVLDNLHTVEGVTIYYKDEGLTIEDLKKEIETKLWNKSIEGDH